MSAIMLTGQVAAATLLIPVCGLWVMDQAFPEKPGISDAMFSPKGGEILAVVRTEKTQQLVSLDIQSGRWTQLTHGEEEIAFPIYSPDGERIAYCGYSKNSEVSNLFVLEKDGVTRSITPPDEHLVVLSPRFSPDGKSVVFVGVKEGEPAQLYKVDLASGKLQMLTTATENALNPRFLPSGRDVVFIRATGSNKAIHTLDGQLCLLALDDCRVTPLGGFEFEGISDFVVNPNGRELLIDFAYPWKGTYSSAHGWKEGYIDLLSLSANPTVSVLEPRDVEFEGKKCDTKEWEVERHCPAVSPNGACVAFAQVTEPSRDPIWGTEGPYSVHVMNLDTGVARRVTDQTWPRICRITYSQDGLTLLLISDTHPAFTRRGHRELWTVSLADGKATRRDFALK